MIASLMTTKPVNKRNSPSKMSAFSMLVLFWPDIAIFNYFSHTLGLLLNEG